ncbi:MAG: DUF1272 domain-containing protein [Paracoccus sp. (in: a-proteobacteria)]
MPEFRPDCEFCNCNLPSGAEAMISRFERLLCPDCVNDVLGGTCPNCNGDHVSRPIRPLDMLTKHLATSGHVLRSGG